MLSKYHGKSKWQELIHITIVLLALPALLNANKECEVLAAKGDCQFYNCVEGHQLQCGESGFSLSYGYKYCTKFVERFSDFDSEGQEWLNRTQRCLMEKLSGFYKNPPHVGGSLITTCEKMLHFAFDKQSDCYSESQNLLCQMLPDNYQVISEIMEEEDVIRYPNLLLTQLTDTTWGCEPELRDTCKMPIQQMTMSILKNDTVAAIHGVDADCLELGRNRQCSFYECFEARFPCGVIFSASHVKDEELPLCEKIALTYPLFNEKTRDLLPQLRDCVMQPLVDIYKKDNDVKCGQLRELTLETRAQFCLTPEVLDVLLNDAFAVDRVLQTDGFPFTQLTRNLPKPSRKLAITQWAFSHGKRALRRLLGNLYPRDLYEKGFTEACQAQESECQLKFTSHP